MANAGVHSATATTCGGCRDHQYVSARGPTEQSQERAIGLRGASVHRPARARRRLERRGDGRRLPRQRANGVRVGGALPGRWTGRAAGWLVAAASVAPPDRRPRGTADPRVARAATQSAADCRPSAAAAVHGRRGVAAAWVRTAPAALPAAARDSLRAGAAQRAAAHRQQEARPHRSGDHPASHHRQPRRSRLPLEPHLGAQLVGFRLDERPTLESDRFLARSHRSPPPLFSGESGVHEIGSSPTSSAPRSSAASALELFDTKRGLS